MKYTYIKFVDYFNNGKYSLAGLNKGNATWIYRAYTKEWCGFKSK
jgi:hypothetical protein